MSSERPPSPPWLSRALLSLVLPDNGIRETVLGDLHELFLDRVEARNGRRLAAGLWYSVQTLRLVTHYGLLRIRRRVPGHFGDAEPLSSRPTPSDLLRQVRFAIRSLLRSPGFTVPALLILSIGMTAATAIFTVVDSIVFRPLAFPNSDQVVMVCEDHPRFQGACIAAPEIVDELGRQSRQIGDLGIGRGWAYTLDDENGPTGVRGGLATPAFFRALGAEPILGRAFTEAEFGPGDDKVVLLSHGFWTARYGADPSVVGSIVSVDKAPHQIVGILPEGFEAPLDMASVQLWKPPHFNPSSPEDAGWRGFRAVGRLEPGASVASAGDELRTLYARLAESTEVVDQEWRLRVTPLQRIVVGDTRPVLLAFLGAAGLFLLIVCANVANLLLARGLGRKRELAVRAALGAARGHLVRGILVESLVLTLASVAVAILLAGGAVQALLAMAPAMPRLDEVRMDGRVLAFTALLSVAATLAFALLPSLRVTAWNLAQTIKSGDRGGEAKGSRQLRRAMVVAELALSVLLLATAALLTRSFAGYLDWDPGFERSSLSAVWAFTVDEKYDTREQLFAMWRRAEERAAAIPGVTAVATASAGPLFGGGDGATPFIPEGHGGVGELPSVWWFDVGPGYFSTLGLPVLEGREITEADNLGTEHVAVVNQTMARASWPGEAAVSRTVRLPERELDLRIVGVVADVPPLTPAAPTLPQIYFSNRQLGRPATFFLVRSDLDAGAIADPLRTALLEVDPDISLGGLRTLASEERQALVRPRFEASVLGALALAALALSAAGVYAVVAYSAARRMREMGIRMALGAQGNHVIGLFLTSSLRLTAAGVTLGLLGALAVGRFLEGMIHGVSPADPISLGGAAAVLLAAAAVAAYLPARRATRSDPLQATRAE